MLDFPFIQDIDKTVSGNKWAKENITVSSHYTCFLVNCFLSILTWG